MTVCDLASPITPDQVGYVIEHHQDDKCDCGATADMWQTVQDLGGELIAYSKWICTDTATCVLDRLEPLDDYI